MSSLEYAVEKVVGRRINKGRVEYRIKWVGYSAAENTWESEEQLNCPDLVEEFERDANEQPKKSAAGKIERTRSNNQSKSKSKNFESSKLRRDAEKVIGATIVDGELCFWIKWKNNETKFTKMPASSANTEYPQLVIAFLLDRIVWEN